MNIPSEVTPEDLYKKITSAYRAASQADIRQDAYYARDDHNPSYLRKLGDEAKAAWNKADELVAHAVGLVP